MSTKGPNAVGRDHGQTLHVRGKLDGASCISDSLSVTFTHFAYRGDAKSNALFDKHQGKMYIATL